MCFCIIIVVIIIIIIIVIIHSIINYKYYHNIQTSFGLGVKSWPQRHLQE